MLINGTMTKPPGEANHMVLFVEKQYRKFPKRLYTDVASTALFEGSWFSFQFDEK